MNSFFKNKRLIVFFSFCGLLVIAILAAYMKLAMAPVAPKPQNIPTIERGSIVDRSGFPLAVQTNFYRVGVSTKDIKNAQLFSKNMAPVLGVSEEELFARVDKKREYVILKKKASQTEYEEISQRTKECGYNYVSYEKLPGRVYPNGALASQLIGYMGDEGTGLAGIEFSQQGVLYPEIDKSLETPEQGKNIYLTIDANLQYKLEQIAYKTMENTQAESMMLLAADSKTGEILTYISLPAALFLMKEPLILTTAFCAMEFMNIKSRAAKL